ncbi:MAG: nucleotide exchange factor GrpE [Kiritimatiellae bacterium]|nr:nucleotide exchange factor GrpE [Kiritimatiellia bacterium]
MNSDDLKNVSADDTTTTENVVVEEQTIENTVAAEPAVEEETPAAPTEETPVEETTAEEAPAEEAATESTEEAAAAAEEPEVEPAEEAPAQSEADIYRERLMRLQADFDNYRKRMARDKADMIKSANAELLSAMLPALDHIDSALASLEKTVAAPAPAEGEEAKPAEPNPYIEGFKLIQNELLRGLDKFGLKPVESLGKPFDVEYHEALSKMPTDSVPPEHVLFEVRKGYTLNGKVLRAAQVIVSVPVE